MQQATPMPRPIWVTVLGILYLIGGALAAVAGIIVAAGGAVLGAVGAGTRGLFGPLGAAIGGALILAALFLLLFGAVYVVCGIGLLKGRRWARVLALVLLWIGGIVSLLSLLVALGTLQFVSALGNLIGVGLAALFLIKLYSVPVRGYFGVKAKAPPAAPAVPSAPPAPSAPQG